MPVFDEVVISTAAMNQVLAFDQARQQYNSAYHACLPACLEGERHAARAAVVAAAASAVLDVHLPIACLPAPVP